VTLRAEIGDATRFPGGPALASYAGLVPRVESSGEHVYHGRITRQGSPWIRWAVVDAARYATRRPDARAVGPSPRGHERPGEGAGGDGPGVMR